MSLRLLVAKRRLVNKGKLKVFEFDIVAVDSSTPRLHLRVKTIGREALEQHQQFIKSSSHQEQGEMSLCFHAPEAHSEMEHRCLVIAEMF